MIIQDNAKSISLVGSCKTEDAECLYEALNSGAPDLVLDLGRCDYLHGAVLQVILTQPRKLAGLPVDPVLRDWAIPLLKRAWEDHEFG